MNRRKLVQHGFVNFPMHLMPSSGEGGMFVRLVVVEKEFDSWRQCAGGQISFQFDESLIGDDKNPQHRVDYSQLKSHEEFKKADKKSWEHVRFHFPQINEYGEQYQYNSIGYLAVINLGSTGWSNADWLCKFEDLTDDGKILYRSIEKLYDGCDLYLQTWLDT